MNAADVSTTGEKTERVPQWVQYLTDEQFIQWCQQHKLQVCSVVRTFSAEERSAIFRYALRQHLVN